MIDKSKLTDSLIRIELELRNSKKNETADFFKKTVAMVSSETDKKKLRTLLEQVCSSGAMTQYANFTYQEEQLFDECFDNAKELLSMI